MTNNNLSPQANPGSRKKENWVVRLVRIFSLGRITDEKTATVAAAIASAILIIVAFMLMGSSGREPIITDEYYETTE